MLQIRIDQQYAKIGLDIQKPQLSMQTTLPAIELDIEKPTLEIHSPRPRLTIDQSQCFADMGKRGPSQFMDYYAGLARQMGLEGIAAISAEGDALANWQDGNTVESLAAAGLGETIDFNLTAIPKQPPRIEWDIRPVEINYNRGRVGLQLRRGQIQTDFQWGKVSAYLRQQNYLNITWHEQSNRSMYA